MANKENVVVKMNNCLFLIYTLQSSNVSAKRF